MNMLEISQIIIGLGFFLFIPGYLTTKIFFDKTTKLEKILLSVVFSIMIGIAIGIFFGYNKLQAQLTGGFTFNNIFISEIIITFIIATILYLKRRINTKTKHKKQILKTKELKF